MFKYKVLFTLHLGLTFAQDLCKCVGIQFHMSSIDSHCKISVLCGIHFAGSSTVADCTFSMHFKHSYFNEYCPNIGQKDSANKVYEHVRHLCMENFLMFMLNVDKMQCEPGLIVAGNMDMDCLKIIAVIFSIQCRNCLSIIYINGNMYQ